MAWHAVFFVVAATASAALANDFVILDGRVIDPETGLDAIRNLAMEGDKIVAIREFPLERDLVIDATGHVVSPDFIDIHSYGQNIGDYRMQVIQGVTTELELESGLLPVGDWYEARSKKNLPMNYGTSAAWVFARTAALLHKFSGRGFTSRIHAVTRAA